MPIWRSSATTRRTRTVRFVSPRPGEVKKSSRPPLMVVTIARAAL
jgi:hypothetical protein